MLTPSKRRSLRKSPAIGPSPSRLRAAIELAGVTQMQVADAVKVSQSQVSEDAAGKFAEMSLEKARAYASYFDCDIKDIFPERQAVAS